MQQELSQLKDDVRLILYTLKGNPEMGIPGLAEEIKSVKQEQLEAEKELKDLKKFIDRSKWFLMGGIVFGGYGLYDIVHEVLPKLMP